MQRDEALWALEQTGYFQSLRWVDEVTSTNRILASELKSATSPPLPALLVADRQTAGVGRGTNAWWSPPGCLMFSMAVPWSNPSRDLAKMPLRVGMAVAQALADWSTEQPKVKWPNDVYIDDRKVCGILIESSILRDQGNVQEYSIIGIGINCCVDWEGGPEGLQGSAISLHHTAPRSLSGSICPESILVAVVTKWLALGQRSIDDPEWLDREWPHWSWLDGKWVEVISGGCSSIGVAEGIEASGALRIRDRFGRPHAFLSGTVRTITGD
jgi:BirA family biotin operon repressor/biotin-[acetyl-CoA-carboxylase] ligase